MVQYRLLALLVVWCAGVLFAAPPLPIQRDFTGVQSVLARIHTHEGVITLELDFRKAPHTVANFISLAQQGFYNGTIFHRVIQGFMIQGGDPQGNGQGGPGYTIPFESNDLVHQAGVISMANTGDPHSGGSQFFITHKPQPHLDGKHVVFGRVVDGLPVVYLIEQGDPMVRVEIEEKKTPAAKDVK